MELLVARGIQGSKSGSLGRWEEVNQRHLPIRTLKASPETKYIESIVLKKNVESRNSQPMSQ